MREGDWQVAPAPPDARRTAASRSPGPTDRKMVINALNSGADGFMADFEDSNSPDLAQHDRAASVNLTDAIEGTIEFSQATARSTG